MKLSFVFFRTFFKRSVLKPIERVSVCFWKREGKIYWSHSHIAVQFLATADSDIFSLFLSATSIMAGSQLPLTVSKASHDRQTVAFACQQTHQDRQAVASACQQDASWQACICLCLSARHLRTGRQLPLPVSKTPQDRQAVASACQQDASWKAGSCLCLSAWRLMAGRQVFACQQDALWQAGSCLCLSAWRLMTGRQVFACQQDALCQAGSCLCLSARRLMTGSQLPASPCK